MHSKFPQYSETQSLTMKPGTKARLPCGKCMMTASNLVLDMQMRFGGEGFVSIRTSSMAYLQVTSFWLVTIVVKSFHLVHAI